jgi:hypothetical protein
MPSPLSSSADEAPAIARYERAVRAAQALVLVLTVLLGAYAPASPYHRATGSNEARQRA